MMKDNLGRSQMIAALWSRRWQRMWVTSSTPRSQIHHSKYKIHKFMTNIRSDSNMFAAMWSRRWRRMWVTPSTMRLQIHHSKYTISNTKYTNVDSWQISGLTHRCLQQCGQGGGDVCGSPPRQHEHNYTIPNTKYATPNTKHRTFILTDVSGNVVKKVATYVGHLLKCGCASQEASGHLRVVCE